MSKHYPLSAASKEFNLINDLYPDLQERLAQYPQLNTYDEFAKELGSEMLSRWMRKYRRSVSDVLKTVESDSTFVSTDEIYYWGDMDTDGLEILARYRQAGLPCESILMTLDDFNRYEEYGTRYSKDNGQVFVRCEDEALAAFLTDAERGLYFALCGDSLKKNRIEQEKIPFQDALNYVKNKGSVKG